MNEIKRQIEKNKKGKNSEQIRDFHPFPVTSTSLECGVLGVISRWGSSELSSLLTCYESLFHL